jgi:uncharacterized protein YjbI with pentapeptide repeats
MLLPKWLKLSKPAKSFIKKRRIVSEHLEQWLTPNQLNVLAVIFTLLFFWRDKIPSRLKRLISWQSLTVVVVITVGLIFQPYLWPGGFGFGKGESVATKTVESVGKNAQGQITKTIETTKIDDGKTLWDWLSVLGVPLTLLFLGSRLQQSQQERAEKVAQEQREIAADEKNEEVLQVYFDRLSVLLVDKNLREIADKVEATAQERELLDSAVYVIRARTLSILRQFENDPKRKPSVIQFLLEADIVSKLKLSLRGADLSGANLSGADLSDTDLSGANLSSANLSGANLSGANLSGADLLEVNLSSADLSSANLNKTDLFKANLSSANLNKTDLSSAKLLSSQFVNANLSGADLSSARLSGADLSGARLSGADLSGADLSGVILLATDLRGTRNLKQQQLEGKDPPILCNVALPEGIPDRDRLKDRDRDLAHQEVIALRTMHAEGFISLDKVNEFVEKLKEKPWT